MSRANMRRRASLVVPKRDKPPFIHIFGRLHEGAKSAERAHHATLGAEGNKSRHSPSEQSTSKGGRHTKRWQKVRNIPTKHTIQIEAKADRSRQNVLYRPTQHAASADGTRCVDPRNTLFRRENLVKSTRPPLRSKNRRILHHC